MVSKYFQKNSTHYQSEKCKSKLLLRFHSSLFRMAPSRKTNDHQSWLGHGEKQVLTHCWRDCKRKAAVTETGMEATQTLKLELLHDLAVLLLGLDLKDSKSFPRETCTARVQLHCS